MSYACTAGSGTSIYCDVYGTPTTPSASDQLTVAKSAFGAAGGLTLVTTTAPLPVRLYDASGNASPVGDAVARRLYVQHTDGTNSTPSMDAVARAGYVVGSADVISVTLVLDTSAYASGDLLVDAQAIASALRVSGGQAKLTSLLAVDEDDQGVAMDVYVSSSSSTWGTFNVAPTITDAVARSVQAIIPIASGDWKDLGGVRVANIKNIGAVVEGNASTSLYVAVVNGSGSPTFSASGVKLVFGFEQF